MINLDIAFSEETEVGRIQYTLGKLDWFKIQRYKINLPNKVNEIIDQGLIPTEEEIRAAVSAEFNEGEYKQKAQELRRGWNERKDELFEKLETLGLPLQSEYKVIFTKYGVGGSYALPNIVQINFDYNLAKEPIAITLHEITHLTIEELIKKHNIGHWEKERIVDLVYAKFYPDEKKLQRNPERAEMIEEIFNSFFPNIEKIIIEVSKLNGAK